jgi:tetratricopeptide (TPR) repeat protein
VKLDREIESYMTRRSLQILTIKGSALPTGEIATRVLRPGEAAVMPVVMRSKRGAGSEETARSIVADARAVAARFPADAAVLAALAEAEHDAGNDDAAIAAADAALAIDPANVNAHLRKGYALFDKAQRSRDETAMRDARRAFVALNRVENDHPVPLYRFYLSHVSSGAEPTANAIAALEQAAGIAPYAREVSLALAHRRLVEGRLAEARIALQPIAFNPHGGPLSAKTREFMRLIDAAAEAGDTSRLAGQLRSLVSADDGDEAGPGASDGPVKPAGGP